MKKSRRMTGILRVFSLIVIGGLVFTACPNDSGENPSPKPPPTPPIPPINGYSSPMRLWYNYPA
ncbi:MAG: hypothetical protein LBU82_01360, partial [Treponema sp.]|nr:hypothetical protein [Treponema sp.]